MQWREKPLRWIAGEVKTPPFSQAARVEAGILLRRLQRGESLGMPHSRPLRTVGKQCYELRIRDRQQTWRIVYRADPDAVVVLEVFGKKTRKTPRSVIERCRRRLQEYDGG